MLQPRSFGIAVLLLLSPFVTGEGEVRPNRQNVADRLKRDNGDVTVLSLEENGRLKDPPVGVLSSTARTFVNGGATTEFATQILGTTVGRTYARLLSTGSKVYYDSSRPVVKEPVLVFPTIPGILTPTETQTQTQTVVPAVVVESQNEVDSATSPKPVVSVRKEFSVKKNSDVKPAKVKPNSDLPTVTIKAEFAPSGYENLDERRDLKKPRTGKGLFRGGVQIKNEFLKYDTVTYVGFADFTTTVGNTIIIFMPKTAVSNAAPVTSIAGAATLRPEDAAPTVVTTVKTFMSHSPPVATKTVTGHNINTHTSLPTIQAKPERSSKSYNPVYVTTEESETTTVETTESTTEHEMLSTTEQPTTPPFESSEPEIPTEEEIKPTEALKMSPTFATTKTRVFIEGDEPLGLAKSVAVIEAYDSTTTYLTSFLFGTVIDGQYTQLTQVASSTLYPTSTTEPTTPSEEVTTEQERVPKLVQNTIQQTYTYYTTFFIPKGDTTSTSIKTREVVSDEVRYVTDAIEPTLASASSAVEATTEPAKVSTTERPEETTEFTTEGITTTEQASENDVEVILKTLYTTYTYLTTFFKENNATSVQSRELVETNIVTSTLDKSSLSDPAFADLFSPTEVVERPPIASTSVPLKTYTYYTTVFVDGETLIESRTEVVPEIQPTSTSQAFKTKVVEENNVVPYDRPSSEPLIMASNQAYSYDTTMLRNDRISATKTTDETEASALNQAREEELKKEAMLAIGLTGDSEVVETMVTDVTSSSSGGPREEPELDPNDQISSESNTEEIEPSFSPTVFLQTSYTTFTYFTTVYKGTTSDIISRLETVTNLVTETVKPEIEPKLSPEEATLPITYFTTFTYWTTLYKGKNTMITSREETVSNIVTPTLTATLAEIITPTPVIATALPTISPSLESSDESLTEPLTTSSTSTPDSIEPSTTEETSTVESTPTPHIEPVTHYTTYTYFTTSYIGNETVINSHFETETSVGPATEEVTSSTTTESLQPTGLISTIRTSLVNDGLTTLLKTDVYGTYIDGLYAQVLESSSEIIAPTSSSSVETQPTGIVSINEGKIIDAEGVSTTLFTTKAIGTYIDNLYAQVIESTSSVVVDEARRTVAPEPSTTVLGTKVLTTGLVRLIEGSIVKDRTTTLYESRVIGTVIDGRYAQIIESTSSFKSDPSSAIVPSATEPPGTVITPTAVSASTPSPAAIESSIEDDKNSNSGKKKPFTPVIRPFSSRPRPTFSPKKKTGDPATTITRASFTPTVTATPASKTGGFGSSRNRFAANRSKASVASQEIKPTSSSSRRFSRPRGSTSAFGSTRNRSSTKVAPTSASSRSRPGFSYRSTGRPTFSASSAIRGRIRPSLASSSLRHASTVVEDLNNNDITGSAVTDESEPVTAVEEEATSPPTTESPRRANNPLLRFRRPPILQRSSTTTTTTPKPSPTPKRPSLLRRPDTRGLTTPRPKPSVGINRSKARPASSLFPPRGLKKTVEKEEEEVKEDDEANDEDPNEEVADNEYEGSETAEHTSSTTTEASKRRSKTLGPVQIRPFVRRPRTRRQAEYGNRGYSSRYRRPSQRTREPSYDYEENYHTPEPPKPTRGYSRRTSQYQQQQQQQQIQQQARVKPSPVQSTPRHQFTLRERTSQATTPAPRSSNFRRPTSSRRRTEATTQAQRLAKRPRTTTEAPRTSRRYSSTQQQHSRRTTTRARYREEDVYSPKPFDGTITVTHKIPTEVTIPYFNGKNTEYKNVITAKPSLQVLGPHQYTQSLGKDGKPTSLLVNEITSTLPSGFMEVTKFIILETPTTSVTFTPTTLRGRKTSFSHIVPSTVYEIKSEVSTVQPNLGNAPLANLLLSQLLLGNLQPTGVPGQPASPTTEFKTKTTTYVTTVTSHTSTVLPLTFRGKAITTTIIDSSTQVITATEYITETVVVTPTAAIIPQNNQLNSLLLPALLQAQLLQTQSPIQTPKPVTDPYTLNDKLDQEPERFNRKEDQDDEDRKVRESTEDETETHAKGNRKKLKQKPGDKTVITLYVSGKHPGEFTTVLSTVPVEDAPLRKREVKPDDIRILPSALPVLGGSFDENYSTQSVNELQSSEVETQSFLDNTVAGHFLVDGRAESAAPDQRMALFRSKREVEGGRRRVVRVRIPVKREDVVQEEVTESTEQEPVRKRVIVTRRRPFVQPVETTADSPSEQSLPEPDKPPRKLIVKTRRRPVVEVSSPVQRKRITVTKRRPVPTETIPELNTDGMEMLYNFEYSIPGSANSVTVSEVFMRGQPNQPEPTLVNPVRPTIIRGDVLYGTEPPKQETTTEESKTSQEVTSVPEIEVTERVTEVSTEKTTTEDPQEKIQREQLSPPQYEDEDEYVNENDQYEYDTEETDQPEEVVTEPIIELEPSYLTIFPYDDSTSALESTTSTEQLVDSTTVEESIDSTPTLSSTTILRTTTTTRFRTFTYVVTRVSGDEQIITSSTSVRPDISTVTLTETVAATPSGRAGLIVIEPRHALATKVMANGVQVIVAGDKSTLPGEPSLRVIPTSLLPRPLTLAPSTLTDHMMMVLPQETQKPHKDFVTKTYMTTYTYLTTFAEGSSTAVSSRERVVSNVVTEEASSRTRPPGHVTLGVSPALTTGIYKTTYTYLNTLVDGEQPLVVTSKKTVANTVTEPPSNERPSSVSPQSTNTYLSTVAYTKTLSEGDSTKLIPAEDVLTQVVITESDFVPSTFHPEPTQVPSLTTTDVVKTYWATYTYFKTKVNGGSTVIKTEVATSSDVVTEKFTRTANQPIVSQQDTVNIYATKTYMTTFTYFTTLLQDKPPGTVVKSRTKVQQNIVTESIAGSLLDPDDLSLLKSSVVAGDGEPIVTTAMLSDGHRLEVTAVNSEMVKPTAVLATPSNTVTGSTVIFFDDPPIQPSISDLTFAEQSQFQVNTQTPQLSTQTSTQLNAQSTPANHNTKVTEDIGGSLLPEIPSPALPSPANIFNGLNALGPVINAMADLFQNNFNNKKKDEPARPQPLASPFKRHPPPPTTQRSPVYIPNDSDLAESQHINNGPNSFSGDTHQRTKTNLEEALLSGGIPISPGQVITTNSDVIIGKHAVHGPRPPGKPLDRDDVEGMKPPPPPPSLKPNWAPGRDQERYPSVLVPQRVSHVPNGDSSFGQHPPTSRPNWPPRDQDVVPSVSIPQRAPPARETSPVSRPSWPSRDQYPTVLVPPRVSTDKDAPVSVQISPKPANWPAHPQHKHKTRPEHTKIEPPKKQKYRPATHSSLPAPPPPTLPSPPSVQPTHRGDLPTESTAVKDVKVSVQHQVGSKPEELQPYDHLLVNIQPSQVANVVIPHGVSTALVYNARPTEHSQKGEIFNEPSPYPDAEVGMVGVAGLSTSSDDDEPLRLQPHHRPAAPPPPPGSFLIYNQPSDPPISTFVNYHLPSPDQDQAGEFSYNNEYTAESGEYAVNSKPVVLGGEALPGGSPPIIKGKPEIQTSGTSSVNQGAKPFDHKDEATVSVGRPTNLPPAEDPSPLNKPSHTDFNVIREKPKVPFDNTVFAMNMDERPPPPTFETPPHMTTFSGAEGEEILNTAEPHQTMTVEFDRNSGSQDDSVVGLTPPAPTAPKYSPTPERIRPPPPYKFERPLPESELRPNTKRPITERPPATKRPFANIRPSIKRPTERPPVRYQTPRPRPSYIGTKRPNFYDTERPPSVPSYLETERPPPPPSPTEDLSPPPPKENLFVAQTSLRPINLGGSLTVEEPSKPDHRDRESPNSQLQNSEKRPEKESNTDNGFIGSHSIRGDRPVSSDSVTSQVLLGSETVFPDDTRTQATQMLTETAIPFQILNSTKEPPKIVTTTERYNIIISATPKTSIITHTQTLTVTSTESKIISESKGSKPSTSTLILTRTSTLLRTVTEVQTILQPSRVLETVTTTIHPVPSTPPPKPSPEPTKDTILVVMSDKGVSAPPTELGPPPEIEGPEEEENEVSPNVLLGGLWTRIPSEAASDSGCQPQCKASRNERCQKVDGTMRCTCRPGFARMFPERPCKPTYTFRMEVPLERVGKDKLPVGDRLSDNTSSSHRTLTGVTKEALDRAVMQSDLRDIYHGMEVTGFHGGANSTIAEFYIQLSENTNETKLVDTFKKHLRVNNFSMGGTDLIANRDQLGFLKAIDFDECSDTKFHDCSENAQCFNLRGTYTCSCKEGYTDLSLNTLYPGRVCSAEMIGCDKCNYHGNCYTRENEEDLCECFQWYAGQYCQINLKVLLLILSLAGISLVILLIVCLLISCMRRRPLRRTSNLRPPGPFRLRPPPSRAQDKRAMIGLDTSSETSLEHTPPPYLKQTMQPMQQSRPVRPPCRKQSRAPSPPTTVYGGGTMEQRDRSLTVMIPRAKYRPAPTPTMSTFGPEQRLLKYLTTERPQSSSRCTSRKPSSSTNHSQEPAIPKKLSCTAPPRKPSTGALVSAGFEVSATVGRTKEIHDCFISEPHTDLNRNGFSTIRTADSSIIVDIPAPPMFEAELMGSSNVDFLTVSEARSYDETTIQPPVKCLGSLYDKHSILCDAQSDGHTMVERDLGSTFMPQSQLFKPGTENGSDISNFDSL